MSAASDGGRCVFFHGSGFDPEFGSGHFRTITLPPMEVLEEAYDKIERFIKHNTD